MPDITFILPRWLPILLAGTGAVTGAKLGAPGIVDLVNLAKIAGTRYELSDLARRIQLDTISGFPVPNPHDPSSLGAYIRKIAWSPTGRDPSQDLWGHPYVLEVDGPKTWKVRSFGPNGAGDLCPQDTWAASIPGVDTGSANDAMPEPSGKTSIGDDVCVVVKPEDY